MHILNAAKFVCTKSLIKAKNAQFHLPLDNSANKGFSDIISDGSQIITKTRRSIVNKYYEI